MSDGGIFDPAIAIHGGTFAGVHQIYDWVNYLDEGFVITAGMAELPEVVDELNFIYTIKPNVYWHDKAPLDGRQFTAEDAVFGLERFGFDNPEFVFKDRFSLIDKFEAPDQFTMTVQAGEVFSPILTAIAEDNMLIVSRDAVEAFGDEAISTDFEAQIGTGAMVGVSREADVELRLERNPNYYKEGQPYFDGYKGISLGDDAIRIASFVNGQTDFLNYQWFGRPVDLDSVIAELGEDAVTGVPNPVTYGMATHIHTEVDRLLGEMLAARERAAQARALIDSLRRSARGNGANTHVDTRQLQERFDRQAERLRALGEELESLGVQLKDLDRGLVDWPAERHGETVLICWLRGEEDIGWWHDLYTGFAGRQPIIEEEWD